MKKEERGRQGHLERTVGGADGMPPKITLDTNLFYDKALGRAGAADFDVIIYLARAGRVLLFFTATTDFEDRRSAAAIQIALRLMREGLLQEAQNAGTHHDYMPGGPGLHVVNENQCNELLRLIWPEGHWVGASDNQQNDVRHLLAHMLNGHDIYVTRDGEILQHRDPLKEVFGIMVMSPRELIDSVTQ